MTDQQTKDCRHFNPKAKWAWLGFVIVAGFFLWTEHRAHLLGALPYLVLLACPLIHLFMHGGHGHSGHDALDQRGRRDDNTGTKP